MKTLLAICLFLCALPAIAQEKVNGGITYLTRDSIPFNFSENWRYHSGDNLAWSAPDFNDEGWEYTDPGLKKSDGADKYFKGIGWFRLHVEIDSYVSSKPLAITMSQYGSADIYIDGEKIKSYGKIAGTKKDAHEFDPHHMPLPIHSLQPGRHIIAVRYQNYYAAKAWNYYDDAPVGFSMNFGHAEFLLERFIRNKNAVSTVVLLFCGFFIALSLLHFFLWAFYRSDKSNMYFSMFCLSTGVLFFLPVASGFTNWPKATMYISYAAIFSCVAMAIALSGVSNTLFGSTRVRFRIIVASCLFAGLLSLYYYKLAAVLFLVLMIVVTLESIILTIRAIYKKIPGSRIVGVGILLATMFLFGVLILAIIYDGIRLEEEEGIIFLGAALLALLSIPVSMSIYLSWSFATTTKNLDKQLAQVQVLSEKTLQQEQEKQRMLETRSEELEKEVELRTVELAKRHEELKEEKHKSDELLRNILPEEVAEELKQKGATQAKYFDHVSVLFTDFVNFTKAGERMTPQELVNELHTCFKAFDGIISKYGIEKIKTIGDAYLAVAGLPVADEEHAVKTVLAAMEIKQFMNDRLAQMPDKTFHIRIGINSGAVVAGIVGVKKFAYDIWGDTVNTAARMEQCSEPDKINISEGTYQMVKHRFACSDRGEIAVKNKGGLRMYFVEGEHADAIQASA